MDMYLDPQLHREVHQSGEKTWIFKFKDHRANRWHEWCYVRERKGSDRQEMTSGQRASPMGAIFTAAGGPITFRRLTKSQKPAIGSVGQWRMADDGNSFEFRNWACCFGANLLPRLVWTLDLSYAPHIVFREQHRSMLLMGCLDEFFLLPPPSLPPPQVPRVIPLGLSNDEFIRCCPKPERFREANPLHPEAGQDGFQRGSRKRNAQKETMTVVFEADDQQSESSESSVEGPEEEDIVIPREPLEEDQELRLHILGMTGFWTSSIETNFASKLSELPTHWLPPGTIRMLYHKFQLECQVKEASCSYGLSSVPVTFSGGLKTDETGIHAFIFMRFRYPKTSVHLPAEGLPIRFWSILSTYTWPKQFLSVIAHEYGEQWLINRLKTWKWSMSTAFSGVGAILSLQNAARKFLFDRSRDRKGLKTNHVTLTSSCEIMKPCQQILRDTYGHCNYPGIMGVCLDHGNRNFCSTHQKLCKNVECKGLMLETFENLGPVCVSFSAMGKRLQEQDIAFATHEQYYKEYTKCNDLLILENVPEYKEKLVASHLGPSWAMDSTRLDPRIFGMGVSRPRVYIICWRKNVLKWTADFRLDEFVWALAAKPVLTAGNYFWQKIPETTLTAAEERNLMDYRAMANMAYPDLTQYPKNGRPRGELRDGSLMALTTNCSKFFSEEHHRFMEPTELLSAQTLPTTRLQERACLAPKLEIKGVNQNLIPKFAGNSMSTPCVGCVLLAALCGLERI
ncbi:PABC domain-containing protein [Durusdinium trenchii]|uniref:PABC domain-containing protein n=1 Tax=Durusdinium trenchii TaxID=1381693 RepID=A0ABP0L5H4_9DINO